MDIGPLDLLLILAPRNPFDRLQNFFVPFNLEPIALPSEAFSMIISRTPYRVSFFGGGTDYAIWYHKYGGQVLSTSINQHIYITCRSLPPFFDHRLRLSYSTIEECSSVDEIMHPSAREILRFLGIRDGIEIH